MEMWKVTGTMERIYNTDDGVTHADLLRLPIFFVETATVDGAREQVYNVLTCSHRITGPVQFNVQCAATGEHGSGMIVILEDGERQVTQLQPRKWTLEGARRWLLP